MAAGAVWIVVTGAVCGNERLTSPFVNGLCNWTQVIPDSAALLVVVGVGFIVWLLVDLQKTTGPRQRGSGEWMITHYAKTPHYGYMQLEDEPRRLVRGGVEAAAWVAVAMFALLAFYWFEFTVPLGVLAIAGMCRAMYAGGRHVIAAWKARKVQKPKFPGPPGTARSTPA